MEVMLLIIKGLPLLIEQEVISVPLYYNYEYHHAGISVFSYLLYLHDYLYNCVVLYLLLLLWYTVLYILFKSRILLLVYCGSSVFILPYFGIATAH